MEPIQCENLSSSYEGLFTVGANCPKWRPQVWHVLSFPYISLLPLEKCDMFCCSTW